MTYLAIVAWNGNNRLTKYQDYKTQAEAEAHTLRVSTRFPSAFVALHPGGGSSDWLIDPLTSTLSVVPIPPPAPPVAPLSAEELYDILVIKGVVGVGDRPRQKPEGLS